MWIFQDKEITSIEQVLEGAYAFIYLITNIDKKDENGRFRQYIGKKQLYSVRKVSLTKKEIAALENKRLKKWKTVIKETDWISYTGSCKELNDHIKEGDRIVKEILEFTFSKRETYYKEVKYQFLNNVLEEDRWYNGNIMNRFYMGNLK